MSVYLWIRVLDMTHRGVWGLLSRNRTETWLFGLEIALLLVPTLLLYLSRVRRNPLALYACAVAVILGFVTNRLNVGITGLEAGSGTYYIPKWSEVAVTLSICALGFAAFRIIGQYFPIFESHPVEDEAANLEEKEPEPVAVA
jgi:Ni/Fe-hydrogenase subunit HybB-like protein